MTDTPDPKPQAPAEAANANPQVPAPGSNAQTTAKPQAKQAGNQGGPRPRKNAEIRVIEVAPVAVPAKMRRRHWGLILSFFLLVVLPALGAAWYLWERAVDQYGSDLGFTVREDGGGGAADFLGGFASQLAGGGQSDTDILYEFIQSQGMVAKVDAALDLKALYSAPYDQDPVFALNPNATFEDLVEYWDNIVRIAYDPSTRLMMLEVRAFSSESAQTILTQIFEESQELINSLNALSRADALRYAQQDLAAAETRLKSAREALILFRTETQSVDPVTDLQARMGVVSTLQQQLAEALIELDLLNSTTSATDPRVVQATRRIEVIRRRIRLERQAVIGGGIGQSGGVDNYPTLLAEYERLIVDREFSEETYRAALGALDIVRASAARQSSYLAAFVPPTLPQTAQYPRRGTLFGLTTFFLFFSWAIGALVYYSVRDSK